jgi:DNA-binding cell septation regulator SpoVG
LRVVDGKNGVFVSMPRQQGKNNKWYDMVAMNKENKELKAEVERVVLEAFQQGVEFDHTE